MANGFDCDEFRPRDGARDALLAHLEIPKDSFVVGFVARNDPIKDHATFFAAAAAYAGVSGGIPGANLGVGLEGEVKLSADLLRRGFQIDYTDLRI